MGRAPCCDKANVKRGPWSPEEDATLKNYIHKNGTGGNWISLPQRAGLRRCGKSCRLRWLNYLRPDIKHGPFTEEEDNLIISMYYKLGSRWSVIAANLQGRTDNDVKNHWNTKLKKKLFGANNKKFNSLNIPPKLQNVPFTNNNLSIINPSSSTPTPSISPSYNYNLDNFNHPNYNSNGSLYVPLGPSFSDLLVQCTNMPNYTKLPNLDYANYGLDPVGHGSGLVNQYPFHQALLMSQDNAANSLVKAEDVSSASGSSSAVCGGGSSFEEDPFLAELGFGLFQEEDYGGANQEDVKPKGLAGQVVNL